MASAYQQVLKAIEKSDREVFEKEWVTQELSAIRILGLAPNLMRMKKSGKKYTNNDHSSVAYLLGITDNAPTQPPPVIIKAGRIDPPDIDLDFEDTRRDEVKTYLAKKWKNAASISTVTKFSSKGLIKDLARVFAIPSQEVNYMTKFFDTLEEFLVVPETQEFRKKYPEIVELAHKFEGRWKTVGAHAAGVVVANQPLSEILPLESRAEKTGSKKRIRVTAYDMDGVAKLGLIKMDALSLSSLTVIHDALRLIKERTGEDIDLNNIPLDDEKVLEEFSKGHTIGTFQTEAQPYTKLLKRMGITSFEDLVASNALVRPGPLLTATKQYIERKHGIAEVEYYADVVESFTKETYGLFIYQEQIMQALVNLGGFSWAEADEVRRIIGKKKNPEEFKPLEERWVQGASKHLGKTRARRMWSDFEKFSGYAFNKAHACAYSLFSYRTMWLKVHYPVEYVYALLNNEKKRETVTTYILEAQRMGVKLLPPDVNKSDVDFKIEPEGIRFGLQNIKGVGEVSAREVMEKRPYESLDEFEEKIERRKCNARVTDILKRAGAFKEIYDSDYDPKEYYYDLLGYPYGFTDDSLGIDFDSIDEQGENKKLLIRAIVKTVTHRPGFTKVDLEDLTGMATFFMGGRRDIEEGSIIVALCYGSDLLEFSYDDELKKKRENDEELNRFEEFLFGKLWRGEDSLYNIGVGKLDAGKSLVMPIGVRTFTVKNGRSKGKSMCRMIVTDGDKFERVVLFPNQYAEYVTWINQFEPLVLRTTPTKDGEGITILPNGLKKAEQYMKEKGII